MKALQDLKDLNNNDGSQEFRRHKRHHGSKEFEGSEGFKASKMFKKLKGSRRLYHPALSSKFVDLD